MATTDDEIAAQLASSPTAQGSGPSPDMVADNQSAMVAQPGDNTDVNLNGTPAEIEMPPEQMGSSSEKMSVSRKGFTGKLPSAYTNADVSDQDKQIAGINQNETGQLSAVDKNTAEAKAARDEQERITGEHNAREAAINQRIQSLNMEQAGAEERASAVASSEGHKYLAAYAQQIAAARQMAVDPTGPIGSMTSAEVGGMTLANFAQGFLNARYGIKIDVSGQIDKWIDRSIQEQQRRVKQAEAGAEDQLHMYEIARQTSHDDSEARTRYHGLVVAGMQGALLAEASKYKSDMASANAAAANAELDAIGIDKKQKIYNGVYDRVEKAEQLKATIRYQNGMLSLQSEKNELNEARKALAAKNKPEGPQPLFIPDLSHNGEVKNDQGDVTHHNVIRMIDPKTPDAAAIAGKISEAGKATAQLESVLDEMSVHRKMAQKEYEDSKGAKIPGFGESWFKANSQAYREYQNDNKKAAALLVQIDYKRPNLTELDIEKSRLPFEKWYQKGSNEPQLDTIKDQARQSYDALINGPGTRDVNINDPAIQAQLQQQGMLAKDNKGTLKAVVPYNEYDKPAADKHRQVLKHEAAVAEAGPEISRTLEGEEVKEATKPSNKKAEIASPAWSKLQAEQQPESAIAVDLLVKGMINPQGFRDAAKDNPLAHTVPEKDRQLVKMHYDSLHFLADNAQDPSVRSYAEQLIETYDKTGVEGLRKLYDENQ